MFLRKDKGKVPKLPNDLTRCCATLKEQFRNHILTGRGGSLPKKKRAPTAPVSKGNEKGERRVGSRELALKKREEKDNNISRGEKNVGSSIKNSGVGAEYVDCG